MSKVIFGLLLAFFLSSPVSAQPVNPAIVSATASATIKVALEQPVLVFDSESKEYVVAEGETEANFVFSLTNVSISEVVITNVATSCGCTIAKLPSQPWHLAPGGNGEIKATMNLAGKHGRVTKQPAVYSSAGTNNLLVHSIIPAATNVNLRGDRTKNMELAKSDRQAVFKGDCASCHVAKGVGKMGKELFAADCGICHETPLRAEMVPNLKRPKVQEIRIIGPVGLRREEKDP